MSVGLKRQHLPSFLVSAILPLVYVYLFVLKKVKTFYFYLARVSAFEKFNRFEIGSDRLSKSFGFRVLVLQKSNRVGLRVESGFEKNATCSPLLSRYFLFKIAFLIKWIRWRTRYYPMTHALQTRNRFKIVNWNSLHMGFGCFK